MKVCPYCKEPLTFSDSNDIIFHECADGFAYYIIRKSYTKA